MPQTLGLIGSGMIGGAIARIAVAAGLDVVLSNSRGPETLAGLVAELGGRARAATPVEAARAADLVVAALPLKAYEQLPADALADRIVIDAMNYLPQRDGAISELDSGEAASSVLVQRHLPGARVVKAFSTIDFHHLVTLARPAGASDRSALPVAGDHAGAKAEVVALLDTLGYDTVDIGGLADSGRIKPGAPAYVQPYAGERPEGLSPEAAQRWFLASPGAAVPAARVKELVESGSAAA